MVRVCIDKKGNVITDISLGVGDFEDCCSVAEEKYNQALCSNFVSVVAVVNDDNEKIGFCSFIIESTEDAVIYQIDYVWVKQGERGQGLSKLMIPYVAQELISIYKDLLGKYSFGDICLCDNSVYISDGGAVFGRGVKGFTFNVIK